MKSKLSRREFAAAVAGAGVAASGIFSPPESSGDVSANVRPLWKSFVTPPADSRIMMRWWWFGPAVTNDELARELREMKLAGLGGVEIQPVYPLALDDPGKEIRNIPYLSDEFLESLRFAHETADALGLRFDLTLASGWPYGGAGVPITMAAGMLRVARIPVSPRQDSVSAPSLEAGETLLAAWAIRDEQQQLSGGNLYELNDLGGASVKLPGDQVSAVWFFISSRTGMQVKRAALGAEGFVIDHYSHAAVENYLQTTGKRLMKAFPGKKPFAIFSDSLEVVRSNWTPDLLEEFQQRRGYDLKPHLPALAGDAGPDSAAFRADWGRTLTELANENYLSQLTGWAHREGTLLRAQNYGEPPVTLSSNRLVDLPEGEDSHWRQFSPARWAASACHLYGKPVTSAETWTWVHSPAFRATPLDLKAEADHNFLQGINQIVGHGWPYSPPSAVEPGWSFYAAGALNTHNPWWPVMPDLALYLQRISFLLRQGKPANDVAIYLSNADAWSRFSTRGTVSVNETLATLLDPNVMQGVLDSGFNYDFIDSEAIERVGIPYRALVLPGVERIEIETYEKIRAFSANGGVLIATHRKPALAPGWLEQAQLSPGILNLTRELFERAGATAAFLSNPAQLGSFLAAKVVPDVELSPPVAEIGFIHRKLTDEEIYFVANTGNRARSVQAVFRFKGLEAETWNPFSGEKRAVSPETTSDGRSRVGIDLAPYQSAVFVFSRRSTEPHHEPRASRPQGASWQVDLSRDWKLSFPAISKVFQLSHLAPWTELPGLKFFSGQGIYEKTISLPQSIFTGARKFTLNFGKGKSIAAPDAGVRGFRALIESPVREAAVIQVNGVRAGSVWHPPYELEVTKWLRPGPNELRITVGNLAINEMAGRPLPSHRLLYERYGQRATPQDMNNLEPLPSGLMGPVTLLAR